MANERYATIDDIMGTQPETVELVVPEWGNTRLILTELTGEQVSQVLREKDPLKQNMIMIMMGIKQPTITPDLSEGLAKRGGRGLTRVIEALKDLSGMTMEFEESVKKSLQQMRDTVPSPPSPTTTVSSGVGESSAAE